MLDLVGTFVGSGIELVIVSTKWRCNVRLSSSGGIILEFDKFLNTNNEDI